MSAETIARLEMHAEELGRTRERGEIFEAIVAMTETISRTDLMLALVERATAQSQRLLERDKEAMR